MTYRVLSWGCGLQSTTLAAMSALGELDRLDAVLTADTGWERQVTYQARDWYMSWLRDRGLYVEVVQGGDVRAEGARADGSHIPFWTQDGGPLNRQCTREFKIRPIKHRIRELLGYDASRPPAPTESAVELWLGITVDEWTRAKRSRVKFIRHRWPLLELRMDRHDCASWLRDRDLPVPPKSACVCCPYRRASEWLEMREAAPDEWKSAVAFDQVNRHNEALMRDGLYTDALYLWREGEPLAEANLVAAANRERRVYATQLPMFACESGYCGI